MFAAWADRWQAASEQAGATFHRVGSSEDDSQTDLARLEALLAAEPADSPAPLWLILLGHGTSDGREAKFNLRGPDLTDARLAELLAPMAGRTVCVLNCSASSSPFLGKLSGPRRVVVTATRSADEQSFSRFGEYLSRAITDPSADLDKDGQVSLLEAYLSAGARTAEFYTSNARLASEHALLDDNADRLGTPADWFRGIHATRRARDGAPLDGLLAHQLHLLPAPPDSSLSPDAQRDRDSIEQELAALRERKATLAEDEYYGLLEPLLLRLARLYLAPPEASPAPCVPSAGLR
jgi:hypothetical protein